MKTKRKELDRNPRIEDGDVDIADDEFDPKYARFRVTMWVDGDVLDAIRKRAAQDRVGYQPWINRKLRELLLGGTPLEDRVAKLEKAVFKRRAG